MLDFYIRLPAPYPFYLLLQLGQIPDHDVSCDVSHGQHLPIGGYSESGAHFLVAAERRDKRLFVDVISGDVKEALVCDVAGKEVNIAVRKKGGVKRPHSTRKGCRYLPVRGMVNLGCRIGTDSHGNPFPIGTNRETVP